MHLLFPLLASLLFVCGLLFVKRASVQGVSPWTVTFLANQWAALVFSTLWVLGGEGQPATQLWQPAIIAALYILGQVCTFSAIQHGDVSVATPVFGIKVVLVSFLVTVFYNETLSASIWWGATMATIGIALVQWSPRQTSISVDDANGVKSSSRRSIVFTIALAIAASISFAMFDVLVQAWAPAWGAGRFLPIVYWIVAVFSLGFLPAFQRQKFDTSSIRTPLLIGTFLIAMQALCIVFTLATFGDAARVNVVYALRAMWGVLLAWWVATTWGGNESRLPKQVMFARLLGATLLTISVIVVVVRR